ncbi:alkaline phosphatase family protein [Terriglobus tenax]|uniref:alkaline phosphatase family protein n=1 Tax=Terriglobus tenax TaxID=1111115 RepID=UPI0021DFDF63|nr:alkaline phosphatase family protein [Terriglobus tenax]
MRKLGTWCVAALLGASALQGWAQKPVARRVFVFVIDGLRPDQITQEKMPNLYRFQKESAVYLQAHSTLPTVTRVNASTLSTGVYPETHGIVSNSIDAPTLSAKPLNTGSEADLVKMASLQGDRILLKDSLSELLTKQGRKFVVISSGSTGGATLLAPEARHGVATVINGSLGDGKLVAYPQAVDAAVKAKFGQVGSDHGVDSLVWAEKVLHEYVLPELKPDVLFDWMTEPDTSQHRYGVGSPEALHALKMVDENFGESLKVLKALGELETTDVIVTADHGFAGNTGTLIGLKPALEKAGLTAESVGILNDGQTVSFFLREKDDAKKKELIAKLAAALHEDTQVAAVFTRGGGASCKAGTTKGFVPGTMALETAHLCSEKAADLVVTSVWNDGKNPFGEPGKNAFFGMNAMEQKGNGAGHGGFAEWTIHIPMMLRGPDFVTGKELDLPSANIDLPATIAYVVGLSFPQAQGRVLKDGMKGAKVPARPVKGEVRVGDAVLHTTSYGGETYVDSVTK